MDDHSYPACLRLAKEAMDTGQLTRAIDEAARAIDMSNTIYEEAQALQTLGIAFRLSGQLVISERRLQHALSLAHGDKPLVARIKRDLAMTLAESLSHDHKDDLFRILAMLQDAMDTFHDGPEYWITSGYIGRAHLNVGNYAEARNALEGADEHLRDGDNQDYELNNLVWLMRVAPIIDRLRYWRRSVHLIKVTGQTRRVAAVCVIGIGGNRLYRFVRQHFGK